MWIALTLHNQGRKAYINMDKIAQFCQQGDYTVLEQDNGEVRYVEEVPLEIMSLILQERKYV